jgi:hypothetical protein
MGCRIGVLLGIVLHNLADGHSCCDMIVVTVLSASITSESNLVIREILVIPETIGEKQAKLL